MSKKALLVGCNYPGTNMELRGCVNDVFAIKRVLMETYGFLERDIMLMIDTDPNYPQPTGENIRIALNTLCSGAQPGDTLVFHYSGHGTLIPDESPKPSDAQDSAIVPTDLNCICDDDLREAVLHCPTGSKFVMISDSCHSQSLLDGTDVISGEKSEDNHAGPALAAAGISFGSSSEQLADILGHRDLPSPVLHSALAEKLGKPKDQTGGIRQALYDLFGHHSSLVVQENIRTMHRIEEEGGPSVSSTPLPPIGLKRKPKDPTQCIPKDVGVLITGCQKTETCADANPTGNPSEANGALTHALIEVITSNRDKTLTYAGLVYAIRENLAAAGYKQNPCLECHEGHAEHPFLFNVLDKTVASRASRFAPFKANPAVLPCCCKQQ